MRRRKWREGKVRPIPGNSPHDRLVSRVISSSLKESLRRSLPRHCFPHLQTILGAQYAFLRHVGIYLVRCGFKIKNQTLGWEPTASRWSAPGPGSRTCREDHAPSHRPQMSSDRLFLDRVARQHCPSPLHRHAQTITHPHPARRKPDISTLQGIGHFYFALTCRICGVSRQAPENSDASAGALIVQLRRPARAAGRAPGWVSTGDGGAQLAVAAKEKA